MPVGDNCEEKNTLSRITTKKTSKRLDYKKNKSVHLQISNSACHKIKNTTLISWLISNYKKPRCTMKYLLSLLLLLSASVFVSCEKDEKKTPRPTPRTEKELLEEYRARYPQLDLSAKADQRVQTLLGPTRRLTEAEMHKALDGTS